MNITLLRADRASLVSMSRLLSANLSVVNKSMDTHNVHRFDTCRRERARSRVRAFPSVLVWLDCEVIISLILMLVRIWRIHLWVVCLKSIFHNSKVTNQNYGNPNARATSRCMERNTSCGSKWCLCILREGYHVGCSP